MDENLQLDLLVILLIFIRCLGFFAITPIFGRREYPIPVKVGFAAFISILLYPILSEGTVGVNTTLSGVFTLVLREMWVGFLLGYVTLLVFSALYVAGELVDTEMGFGMVNVLDPQYQTQVPLAGNFYYMISLTVFLCINGHHQLIGAIIKSFEILPLGNTITLEDELLNNVLYIFTNTFSIGVKIALPIVAMVFLTDFALGIIARTVPQMNVFIVGLPIKILIGIWGVIAMLPMFLTILDVIFNFSFDGLIATLNGMGLKP